MTGRLQSAPLTAVNEHVMQQNSATTSAKVVIAQLCRSAEFQVRKQLCPSTVNRYASAIKAGQELPPLQVALVDGVPCLVDGYHRAAAIESLGILVAEAAITTTTKDEARWMAAKANLTHGLPLKSSELRTAFQVYIRTKQHRLGRGRMKSYRDIAQELGRSHNTIRNWMAEDFPKLFNQYGGNPSGGDGGLHPLSAPLPAGAKAAISHLEEARQVFQETTCSATREAFKSHLLQFAQDLLGQDWQTAYSDF